MGSCRVSSNATYGDRRRTYGKFAHSDLLVREFAFTEMKFILGTKEYMTQVFTDKGGVVPVTVLSAGPVVVTQVKTAEKDGYGALQVGYGVKREALVAKAQRGHTKDLGSFRYFREVRSADGAVPAAKVGDTFNASVFAEGDHVSVSAISKGKGFQGVVKRHGFAGGRRTHGQKHSEREPGSIGGGARAGGRVAKNMRMAGRMGGDRVTVKNLTVVRVDAEKNELYLSGAVPGRRGTLVEVYA